MGKLDLSVAASQDMGLLEIFAQGSVAIDFYHSFRFLTLLSIRPDILREYARKYPEPSELPSLSTPHDVAKALAGRLALTLHVASGDLWMQREEELLPEGAELLAKYCTYIEQASERVSRVLFRREPELRRLRNPLNPSLITNLWYNKNYVPGLNDLVNIKPSRPKRRCGN